MANVGSAHLLIIPKFDNLSASIERELSGVNVSSVGTTLGNGIATSTQEGISSAMSVAAVTVGNIVSNVIGAGVDMIASHVDSAVSRVDTLKNYPQVMQSMGVSAEESTESIDLMSTRLSGLPTTLDTMANAIQGMYAAGEQYEISLTKITKAGLGLNNMLLSGGGSQQVVNSALEQFRQIIAKGKPDMQDWRSLMSAAPGQMNQLAHAMLGATATTNDLYYALGGGSESDVHMEGLQYASISVEELLDAIIELDERGGEGFASFAEQAETAQGGISTAAANFSNAWTRGIASVIDTLGRDKIVGVIDTAKGLVNDFFGAVSDGIGDFGEWLETFDDGKGSIDKMSDAMRLLNGEIETFSGADIDASALEHALDISQEAAEKAKDAHTDYIEQLNQSAEVIANVVESCNNENSSLEYAYSVIERYGDKTGLTALQQWELQSAIDTVNEKCGTQLELVDPLNGKIGDAEGAYDNAAEAVWRYVDAQIAANKAMAYSDIAAEKEDIAAGARNDYAMQKQSFDTTWSALLPYIERYGGLEGLKEWAYNPEGQQMILGPYGQVGYQDVFTNDQYKVQGLIEGLEGAIGDLRNAGSDLAQATGQLTETQAQAKAYEYLAQGGEQNVLTTVLTSSTAAAMFGEGGLKEELSLVDFANDLDQCVIGAEKLMEYLGDEATMAKFVDAFDGGADSLKNLVDTLDGIEWNDDAAAALTGTFDQIVEKLNGLDDETYAAMASMGYSVDELGQKFADAGITTDDLTSRVIDDFADMCQKSNGSIDALIFQIQHYNDTDIAQHLLDVIVNDKALVDAQGRLVVWNGTTMVDKETGVEVDATQLYDAQMKCYEWNGTTLKRLNTSISVDTSSVDAASAKMRRLYDEWDGVTAYTNISATATMPVRAGLQAKGGFRMHSDGAIVNKATFLGDIVGEDGSEAIVPLTNQKYAQPFVDMLAKGINEQRNSQTIINNIYLNEKLLGTDARIDERVIGLLEDLKRLGAGNVG